MKTTTTGEKLTNILQLCLEKGIAFASYRLPLTTETVTLIQLSGLPEVINSTNRLNNASGFVISPFDNTGKHKTYLLKPDIQFTGNEISPGISERIKLTKENISISEPLQSSTTQKEYEDNVSKAVSSIKNNVFKKVVVSKIQTIPQPANFSKTDFFTKLCGKYEHAFVYIIYFPEAGCWCGASPELLIKADETQFQTVSLAGTQVAGDKDLHEYTWSEKELDEQAIVTRFIEQTLVKAGVSDYTKTKPENYQAANLIHLKSGFTFKANDPVQLSRLINALHPTPSVGGLPCDIAKEFILSNEKHDRSYYSGYLGPLNLNNATSLFVNLRCMKMYDNNITLYSGAGITEGSVPQNEWTETENKLKTLKQVIFTEMF